MKKINIILLLITLSFFLVPLYGQTCYIDAIDFTSQAQIDAFPSAHPGCDSIVVQGDILIQEDVTGNIVSLDSLYPIINIEGKLTIGGPSPGGFLENGNDTLVDLSGLENLTAVGGSMYLNYNDALTDLTGLNSLTTVGGSLHIGISPSFFAAPNPNINSLEGLGNLIDIGYSLQIGFCDVLTNLNGFASLNSIGTSITIGNNSALTSLEGLPATLTSVEGISIHSNDALSSLNGLENLNSIGYLHVFYNDGLTSLEGLSSDLNVLWGSLWVIDNDLLTDLTGLENIGYFSSSVSINDNDALTSLEGLNDNVSVIGGSLEIQNNPSLASITELPFFLTTIDGDLRIEYNNVLNSLNGLEGLTSIGGSLWISGNPLLTNLEGMPNLNAIGGNLIINNNDTLTNLEGFQNLDHIGAGLVVVDNDALIGLYGLPLTITALSANLRISNNNMLTNLIGLNNLTSIGGSVDILFNDALTDLTGLDNLTSIGGNLSIGAFEYYNYGYFLEEAPNPKLSSLEGLSSLNAIGGDLLLGFSDSLVNLTGLENLDYTTIQHLSITNNSNLSVCDIQPICDYLENGGAAAIEGNAPGCDSQQEVEDACLSVSVDDPLFAVAIQLYPNPTPGIIHIDLTNPKNWAVYVRDAIGQLVLPAQTLATGQLDLTAFAPGLYLIELRNDQQRVVKKVVLQ